MKRGFLLSAGLLAGLVTIYLVASSDEPPASQDASTSTQWKHGATFPDALLQYHHDIRTPEGESGPAYPTNYRVEAYRKAQALKKHGSVQVDWQERGPGNVSGRTRGLIVDARDASGNTWFAGAVSGGIWKTTNGGNSWTELTADLPNLSFTALAQSASDLETIYGGTGEGFGNIDAVAGDGIWKSTDGGVSWDQLAATAANPSFRQVNRIIVDPSNENILVVATNAAILRSEDGGQTFQEWFRFTGSRVAFRQGFVQQVLADPDNWQIQYAAVNLFGVLKSTDGGRNWDRVLDTESLGDRVELAIAPSNTNVIYAAIEVGNASLLMRSGDAGVNWTAIADEQQEPNWLGAQGWYDNALAVHPFNEDRVIVGGINVWEITMQFGQTTRKRVTGMDTDEVDPFLTFVDFTDGYLPGLGLGPDEQAVDVTEEDFVSVEIRFGAGRAQKAHRFSVPPGSTSGVPPQDYEYKGYIDVPFEVWDITNNRQLTVSFRDNQADGQFNLISSTDLGREYIFVNAIPYDSSGPNSRIAAQAGHTYKLIYFLWVVMDQGVTWNPSALPDSRLRINYEEETVRLSRSRQLTSGAALHVDHHNLTVFDVDESAQTFRVLNGNDGGVGVSDNSGATWRMATRGYNTTQFYGADKRPGADSYVGGTQDNGSFRSQSNPGVDSDWFPVLGGDGFDAIWHATDAQKILVTNQFNRIWKSTDGGGIFEAADAGITDKGQLSAPFLTHISKSRIDADMVFAVGESGIWRSDDFADSWTLIPITADDWSIGNRGKVAMSAANPQTVWAGGRSDSNGRIHLSRDGGLSFVPIDVMGNSLGFISGMATHPIDEGTAYLLFSFADRAKILRTTDFGTSWEDITDFEGGASANGFPDVATYSLLVMPHNPNEIWVGTEIGLFISDDNGESWSYADNGLPAVAIWDMKIVDDEVVVATHGRGIWTATIPELLTAPPPFVPIAPRVTNAFHSLTATLTLEVNLRSDFDSTQVVADGRRVGSIGPTAPADTLMQVIYFVSEERDVATRVVSYKDGRPYASSTRPVRALPTRPAVVSYSQDFSSIAAARDFFGNGFAVNRFDGSLQSDHPYPLNAELIFALRVPIIVSPAVSTFSYDDVALVEPGPSGSTWPQPTFRDYVVVEATKDGVNWIALEDGYDAALDNRWRSLFVTGNPPGAALFVNHTIDLLDHFDAGDKAFFRFRLFSDGVQNGWGWAIDNLEIQPGAPVANEYSAGDIPETFSLEQNYPNPFNPSTSIRFALPERADVDLAVYDIRGRLVARLAEGDHAAGQHTVTWDASGVASGIYVYRIAAGDFIESRRMLLVK